MKKGKLKKKAYARQARALTRKLSFRARENLVGVREAAVHVREGDADQRDEDAAFREQVILAAETMHTWSGKQLAILQQANAHLVISTIESHKLTDLVESARVELIHLAHHDVLTGLPNRLLLQDRLGQAVEAARRLDRQLAVIYMDLDRFKHINDSLGHDVGDLLLQSVAKRLVASVRHSDTVSRHGGDEFVLLLPVIEHAEDAALSVQKILAALAQPHKVEGHDLHISVSMGISIYPSDGPDAQTLIKCADTAMYHAKEDGRNNYKFFEPGMNARAVQRQSIEASLRQALQRQEFVLFYQPKINLIHGTVVGVEALIRWRHPEQGLLMPSEFVSVAEDSGLILPMGRWVLREACRQARSWLHGGLPPIIVSVNTTALEFRAKDFSESVRGILAETQLDARLLELELTESMLMPDLEMSNAVLHALADMGVQLAIDDFGTGYSSLSYLSRLPIHTLKIDQSFISHMTTNLDDAAIVSAVIHMGHSLRKHVIAEGVETPEQLAFLLAQHCDEGQGYYFGRPVSADAFFSLLHTGRPSCTPWMRPCPP